MGKNLYSFEYNGEIIASGYYHSYDEALIDANQVEYNEGLPGMSIVVKECLYPV